MIGDQQEIDFLAIIQGGKHGHYHHKILRAYTDIKHPSEECNILLMGCDWSFISRVHAPSDEVKIAAIKCYIKYNPETKAPSDRLRGLIHHSNLDALFQFYRL